MKHANHGGAIVEFTIVLPLLLTLLLGTMHFGYIFYVYNVLEKSVRDGARYASMRTYGAACAGQFITDVRNTVAFGVQTGQSTPVVPAGNPAFAAAANVDVKCSFDGTLPATATCSTTTNVPPVAVTVRIVSFNVPGTFNTVTLNGKPRATFPYLGRFIPPSIPCN